MDFNKISYFLVEEENQDQVKVGLIFQYKNWKTDDKGNQTFTDNIKDKAVRVESIVDMLGKKYAVCGVYDINQNVFKKDKTPTKFEVYSIDDLKYKLEKGNWAVFNGEIV